MFSKLDSPLYPKEGRLILDPIPPPPGVGPGRNEHKDKVIVVLPRLLPRLLHPG